MVSNQHRTKKRGAFASFITVLFVGIIFCIVGNYLVKDLSELKEKCTKRVSACVVDLKEHTDSEGDKTYSPVLAYWYDDEHFEKELDYSSSISWDVGTEIDIMINPNHPKEVYCEKAYEPIIKIGKAIKIVGIVLIVIAVLILVKIIVTLIIIGGAMGIAAAQTKQFDQQQAQFYGQNQWNQMNDGQTIYTDDLNNQVNQMNPNYQQPQQGQMNQPQQGKGLDGLGNLKY